MHSHYFKGLQSAQIQHCVILHNTRPAGGIKKSKKPLIQRWPTRGLASHLLACHRHIPVGPARTNQRLPSRPAVVERSADAGIRARATAGGGSALVAPLAEHRERVAGWRLAPESAANVSTVPLP